MQEFAFKSFVHGTRQRYKVRHSDVVVKKAAMAQVAQKLRYPDSISRSPRLRRKPSGSRNGTRVFFERTGRARSHRRAYSRNTLVRNENEKRRDYGKRLCKYRRTVDTFD